MLHLEAANRHDVITLLPLVGDIPAVAGKPGRPKRTPVAVVADKAFDCAALRDLLRALVSSRTSRGAVRGNLA